MALHKRVEKLEAQAGPTERRRVHLVGLDPGETGAEARARHWEPIKDGDEVIYLVGVEPKWDADGNMVPQGPDDARWRNRG